MADINHFISGRFLHFLAERNLVLVSAEQKRSAGSAVRFLFCAAEPGSVLQEAQLAALSQYVHAEVRNVLLPVAASFPRPQMEECPPHAHFEPQTLPWSVAGLSRRRTRPPSSGPCGALMKVGMDVRGGSEEMP